MLLGLGFCDVVIGLYLFLLLVVLNEDEEIVWIEG